MRPEIADSLLNIQAQLGDDLGGVLSNQPAPEAPAPEPEDEKEPRGPRVDGAVVKKALAGVVGVGVLAVGGLFGWPYVADFLERETPAPPQLAAVSTPIDAEPTQRFVIDGDNMYLEGSVPDQATSSLIENAASDVLGADRVINNFEISNDAVYNPNEPVQLSVAETVQFGTGEAAVRAQYEPLIALAVELMTSQPNAELTLIGHTDDVGEEASNEALSVRRATTVSDEIVRRGIEPERLTAEGRGELEPIESNDTPEGRAANRRVEFLITGLLR